MESLGHEVVPFEDVVCQMWDMLKLGDRSYVTLQVCIGLAVIKILHTISLPFRAPHQVLHLCQPFFSLEIYRLSVFTHRTFSSQRH